MENNFQNVNSVIIYFQFDAVPDRATQASGQLEDRRLVKPKDVKSLEARIQTHYGTLPPAEKRLADLLLGFPGDIATYSASELAEMAGTSNAAATRFFRRLGYKDFSEARRMVRGARSWGSPVYLSGPEDRSRQSSKTVAAHIARETTNVARTLEALRPDLLREAADALVKARRVFVAGFRNSRVLALYLHRQLGLARDGVILVPSAGETLGEDLAQLDSDDVLVVIGFRRRVTAVERLLAVARRRACRILLIADPSISALPRVADWTLVCEVRSESLYDSYTAPMSVLNLLCGATFRAAMPHSYERLRDIEALHDELEELDTSNWIDRVGVGGGDVEEAGE